ncbi:MAG: transcription factor TFIIIC subunit tfc4 [Candelina mexicana]|nr:MAG: transcription factor TFIIIC subunit tfc4 [Candelina mexicana]
MDHPYEGDSDGGNDHGTVYPDLDFVPSYPWSWQQNGEGSSATAGHAHDNVSSFGYHEGQGINAHQMSQYDDVSSEDLDEARNDELGLSNEANDRSDPAVDPDYHTSDESVASQDELSATNSEDLSSQSVPDSALEGRGTRGAKRGRPRGQRGMYRGRGGRKGIKTGPRRPVDPGPEFRMLQSQANDAFITKEYSKAEELVHRALLVNNEIFSAYSLLSEIYLAQGHQEKSMRMLFVGANTRPGDGKLWTHIASLILDRAGAKRSEYINQVIYCYNRVIERDPRNLEVAYLRANLHLEQKHYGRAAAEYERMLKVLPNDTAILRHLAEVCIKMSEASRARARYKECIAYHMRLGNPLGGSLTWSDANIYVELFGYDGAYKEGIFELKSISRWLLGRGAETFWNEVQEDDREWDSEPRLRWGSSISTHGINIAAYGKGLPLELRIKLGIYRIRADRNQLSEALRHFSWLHPDEEGLGATLFDYPDLFREAADALKQEGFAKEALKFLEPLQQVEGHADTSFYLSLGSCYHEAGLIDEAEECYRTAIESDEGNVEARVQLAIICEKYGKQEQAFTYLNQFITISRQDAENQSRIQQGVSPKPGKPRNSLSRLLSETGPPLAKSNSIQSTSDRAEKDKVEHDRSENIKMLYAKMQALHEQMCAGAAVATVQWMEAASTLIEDFRSYKEGSRNALDSPIPTDYRGIPFDSWLDIFLEYALKLSSHSKSELAYDIVTAAADASVFYHSRDAMFLIHVCWFTCAVRYGDDQTLCSIARWFIREFQFTADAYRLYAALNRICKAPTTWYNSGASQKYLLRQVKAMDYPLVGEDCQRSIYDEKAGNSTKDEYGNPISAEELDVGLLMLYGHNLYAGTSYAYALNYFYRAYALDPSNPMVNLSLALSYIQHALKRQAENRHFIITQGLSFLYAYYDQRQLSPVAQEKQEAEFNLGRAFHMLNLLHLAIPYYQRCIAYSADIMSDNSENFGKEAAVALQELYASTGDLEAAQRVTEEHLVV